MRRAFVLLALIPFGSMAQDSPLKPDGRMWQIFTNSGPQSGFIKSAYVQGAIEGLRVGTYAGYIRGRNEEASASLDYIKPCIDKGPCAKIPLPMLLKPVNVNTLTEYTVGAEKARGEFSTRETTSMLDIVHQMDKFYADYKNTPICMITAAQEAILSLRGAGSSEQELQTERETGCNP